MPALRRERSLPVQGKDRRPVGRAQRRGMLMFSEGVGGP
jgi:hypothetical protein